VSHVYALFGTTHAISVFEATSDNEVELSGRLTPPATVARPFHPTSSHQSTDTHHSKSWLRLNAPRSTRPEATQERRLQRVYNVTTPSHPQHTDQWQRRRAFNFGEFTLDGKAQQPLPELLEAHEALIAKFSEGCRGVCDSILRLLASALKVSSAPLVYVRI